jgi:hypothetical protein
MSTKVSALTQATNAELADASLTYLVIDPSGTPASRKSTLARIGTRVDSWLDRVHEITTAAAESVTAADNTTGVNFIAARTSQTCTGVRFYWPEATARTIRCKLWEWNNATALASVDVTTSGSAGYFTGTFASAVSLDTTKGYQVSVYQTGGNVVLVGVLPVAYGGAIVLQPITRPYECRDYTIVTGAYYGAGGDSRPNTNSTIADRIYSVEPLVSG